MPSVFVVTLRVEVERESGKFMSRDDMAEAISDAIEGADPGSIEGGPDGDSVYSITDWDFTIGDGKGKG